MTGTRMFVAIQPPDQVREQLHEFLRPRRGMTWIDSQQWHITLAFLGSVPEQQESALVDALRRTCLRHRMFRMSLEGAGAFPEPVGAKVLWLRPTVDLTALATGVRHAANSAGATPDGQRFVGHLSVARLRRPMDGRRWLQVLDTFRSEPWIVSDVELVASYLGEGPKGRPRYETIGRLPLSEGPDH